MVFMLTRSRLEILTNVVWIYDTFENNSGIKMKFAKYLKESCWLSPDLHLSFEYSPINAICLK